MIPHPCNGGLATARRRVSTALHGLAWLLLVGALALTIDLSSGTADRRPRPLDAFELSGVRDIDVDGPRFAKVLAGPAKKLKKLLKKLGKTQNKLLDARIRSALYQSQLAITQADLALAMALPEDTPKEQSAKAKAIKKLTKKSKRAGKKISKSTKKIASRQASVDNLRAAIMEIDPDALPPSQLLGLDPGALVFDTTLGGPAPPNQQVTVENLGTVAMNWTAMADAPWVTTTPSGGTLPAGGSAPVDIVVGGTGLTTGSYNATVTVEAPEATNAPPTMTVALSIVPPPVQNGLLGEYFDDIDLTDFVQTRFDPNVDFTTWGDAPTGTSVTPDKNHSERWTGFLVLPSAGNWTFSTLSNDGVRLWIDDVLLIDNWTAHSATEDEATAALTAGWHSVRLEHFQSNGSVVIQWSYRGPGQKKVVVPGSVLTTTLGGNQPPTVDGGPSLQLVLPADMAILQGSASDLDGFIADWLWTQTSGPAATLTDHDTATPTVSGITTTGTYAFGVTVTDDQGATANDTTTITAVDVGQGGGAISGELKAWHRVTVDFTGPQADESDALNPFRDYRLLVSFRHVASGSITVVPGYFAADGQAGETGATGGDVWRAHFTPDAPGTWSYTASFRQGTNAATSLSPSVGNPTAFHGATGSFQVTPTDGSAPGFRAKGRLQYVGDHYLRFSETGEAFLQGGADSPENFLGYVDFDQTPDGNHAYAPHVADWQPGDPVWHGTKGKGIIGSLNYLASMGMNSVYFLAFNVAGDGDDVWPWSSKGERFRFDCSKLDQWEIVFEHMDDLGLQLHVVTQEQENDNGSAGLDNGVLGQERMLYYRELAARFGHHLGVVWNLGEENTNTNSQRRDFFNYIRAVDAYDHPIVLHTYPEQHNSAYGPALDAPILEGATLQNQTVDLTHDETLVWRSESDDHANPWVVTLSEFGPSFDGVAPDSADYWHDEIRAEGLWGNLIAGGAGVEWYFGYGHPHTDLTSEDWRSRHHMWELTDIALDFFRDHLPYPLMHPDDGLVTNASAWCLAQPGQVYAVYMKNGGTTQLDLGTSTASFTVQWYDPRLGGALQAGAVTSVSGPGLVPLGVAPHSPNQDWAILVERD